MTLIEILTAISLFCPHSTCDTVIGPMDAAYLSKESSPQPGCVKKAWKCIDKERKKHHFPNNWIDSSKRKCHGNFEIISGTRFCYDKKTNASIGFDEDETAETSLEQCFR